MQIKISEIPIHNHWMAKIKKTLNVDGYVEQLWLSYIGGGHGKWYTTKAKQFSSF